MDKKKIHRSFGKDTSLLLTYPGQEEYEGGRHACSLSTPTRESMREATTSVPYLHRPGRV